MKGNVFYSGMDASGRLILQPWFAASLERFYAGETAGTRAFDSAPLRDDPGGPIEEDYADRERDAARDSHYAALQDAINSVRGRPTGVYQIERPSQVYDTSDLKKAADRTMSYGLQRIDTISRFRRSRGLDAFPIHKVASWFSLERAIDAVRRRAREEN